LKSIDPVGMVKKQATSARVGSGPKCCGNPGVAAEKSTRLNKRDHRTQV